MTIPSRFATPLGSLLGFGSSFVPKVLDFFKEGRDQRHELAP